jgi:arylsulfatase A-like enzyme
MTFARAATSRRALLICFAATAIASAIWIVRNSARGETTAQPATAPISTSRPAAASDTTRPAADFPLVHVAEPHVLIVSIDGLRPDCMLRAETPNLRSLMSRGSFTMYARTTDVAITTPSHVSMMTGVTPERHGISFNGDPPDDAQILVPTIFDFAHDAGLSTGMASGKRKFTLFTRTRHVDWPSITLDPVGPDGPVGAWAEQTIREHKPRLMFVHFPGADVAGHGIGWGTPEQVAAIGKIDQALGAVLRAYDSAGLAGSTYVIVSADHGGTARSHGRDDVRSRYIPWIFVGPGVRANFDLTRLGKNYDIATYDTFATACYILGLPVPSDSDGKPILAAFEEYDLLSAAAATAPATSPSTGPATKPASATTRP